MLSALGTHLDTLYLSIYCDLPSGTSTILELLRKDAQESEDDRLQLHEIEGLPGGVWYILPYGRGKQYRYILENASFWVAICNYDTNKFPRMDFQFKAATLYEYGTDSYGLLVDRFVRHWFGDGDYKVKVSRADVAVDFQMEDFKIPPIEDVVMRARKYRYEGEHSVPNALTIGRGKRAGALEAKIYNKSMELEQGDKAWMLDVWRASGEYRQELPVWRSEVTFHRKGLAAFEVDTLEDFLETVGDLLNYAVGDGPGGWLRVCEPETRDRELYHHTERRPSAGWWARLREEYLRGARRRGIKRKGYDPEPKLERCVQLAGAHMARGAALFRLVTKDSVTLDPRAWGREMGRIYADMLVGKGTTWAEKVNVYVAELRGVAWRHTATDEDRVDVELPPPEIGAAFRQKVNAGLRQQHELNERRAEIIARSRGQMQAIRAALPPPPKDGLPKVRPDSEEVIDSFVPRLLEVRPSIKHEAGFYVPSPTKAGSARFS